MRAVSGNVVAAAMLCALAAVVTPAVAQQNVDRLPPLGAPGGAFATPGGGPPEREGAVPAERGTPARADDADTRSARDAPRDAPASDARPPAAAPPASACAAIEDEGSRSACWRAYRAELAYREQSLAQRARAFGWQYVSTIGIFFVVLALVLAGLFFAWLQFRADVRRDGGANAPASSVELSAGGLKLTSPVLGTIILALSLGFFYLYLVHVYPIHELN